MEDASRPTIEGLFVNSHLRAFSRERGSEGLAELLRRTGHEHHYASTDDVPVVDEIQLLECIVDITSPVSLSHEERQAEAGRLHLRNFSTTTMWTLVEQLIGRNLKFLFMQSSWIGAWVFTGIQFTSEDLGENRVRITMSNSEYPIAHFKAFFEQWLHELSVDGTVDAAELIPRRHTFTISWQTEPQLSRSHE